jgi:hypothetical protein
MKLYTSQRYPLKGNELKDAIQDTMNLLELSPSERALVSEVRRAHLAKDLETAEHSDRVALMAVDFAVYTHMVTPELFFRTGIYHDAGKLDIPNDVLYPAENFSLEPIKPHVLLGYKRIEPLDYPAARILLYHHKDSGNYPTEIPAPCPKFSSDEFETHARYLGSICLSILDSVDSGRYRKRCGEKNVLDRESAVRLAVKEHPARESREIIAQLAKEGVI